MSNFMHYVALDGVGPPQRLRLAQGSIPVAAAGEVLIRVTASGVNRPDVLQRKGLYPPPPGASEILGLEVAGIIEDGDAEAMAQSGLFKGQRVCALVAGGGYAQYCVAPVGQTLPVPAGLDDVQAASLPETVFTVWSNVFDRARLQRGETLLVHGGSSGIGVMAIQMARAAGARVLVTAGSSAKCEACVALGAEAAIHYKTQDFALEVMRLTGQRGVDVILDMVAGDYLARELPCLREDGRLVLIAVQGGVDCRVDAGLVLRRRLTLTGSTLRARPVAFKAAIARAVHQTVWPWIEQGRVRPVVHCVVPAAQAAQAHELMESGDHIGKIVLTWS
ncbi:MAG: NAD(P)H-quinone oxidoreductase [Rhodoferax sp.]